MNLPPDIDAICAAQTGAVRTHPFGPNHDVWKVGGKIFAAGDADGISLKCADIDSAQMLIAAGVGIKAPYFHRSWVRLPTHSPPDELTHRITMSYALIFGTLPKRVRAQLEGAT